MQDENCNVGTCQEKNYSGKLAYTKYLPIQEEVMQICQANNRQPNACKVLPVTSA